MHYANWQYVWHSCIFHVAPDSSMWYKYSHRVIGTLSELQSGWFKLFLLLLCLLPAMAKMVEETPRLRQQDVPVSGQSVSLPSSPRTCVFREYLPSLKWDSTGSSIPQTEINTACNVHILFLSVYWLAVQTELGGTFSYFALGAWCNVKFCLPNALDF